MMIERDKILEQDLVPLLLSCRLPQWRDEVGKRHGVVRLANLEGALVQTYCQDYQTVLSSAIRFGNLRQAFTFSTNGLASTTVHLRIL